MSKLGIDWGILLIPLALFDISQQVASSDYYSNQNVTKVYRKCGLFLIGHMSYKNTEQTSCLVILLAGAGRKKALQV